MPCSKCLCAVSQMVLVCAVFQMALCRVLNGRVLCPTWVRTVSQMVVYCVPKGMCCVLNGYIQHPKWLHCLERLYTVSRRAKCTVSQMVMNCFLNGYALCPKWLRAEGDWGCRTSLLALFLECFSRARNSFQALFREWKKGGSMARKTALIGWECSYPYVLYY